MNLKGRRPDGTEYESSPVYDENGRVVGIATRSVIPANRSTVATNVEIVIGEDSSFTKTDYTDGYGNTVYESARGLFRRVRYDETKGYRGFKLAEASNPSIKQHPPGKMVYERLPKDQADRINNSIQEVFSREVAELEDRRLRREAEAARQAALLNQRQNPAISINAPSSASLVEVRTFIKQAIRSGKSYDVALDEAYEKFPHSLVNQVAGQS